MRLKVAAEGNAEKNINVIVPRFQAEALRFLRGYDVGVLWNAFYSDDDQTGEKRTAKPRDNWDIDLINSKDGEIVIRPGMATAYGYDIISEEDVHLTAVLPSAGWKYIFVYLEWDFSNPDEAVGKIDIHDNGTNGEWTPQRQDNLINNPLGVYQMILWRIRINPQGALNSPARWGVFGTPTIEHPLYVTNCNQTKATQYAKYEESGQYSQTITDCLNDIFTKLETLGF